MKPTTKTVFEFGDGTGAAAHEQFQEWRKQYPAGFFLNRKTTGTALLHTTHCPHLGDTEWGEETGHSFGSRMKICAESILELDTWAESHGVVVERCQNCAPDFQQELLDNYRQAGQKTGYWGRRFFAEIKRKGGLATVKRMLEPSRSDSITGGWQALIDANQMDLSVEYSALKPEFRGLLTQAEAIEAKRRLTLLSNYAPTKGIPPENVLPREITDDTEFSGGRRFNPKFSDYLDNLRDNHQLTIKSRSNYGQYVRWIEKYGFGVLNTKTLNDTAYISALIESVAKGYNANPTALRKYDWNDDRTVDAKTLLNHYSKFLAGEKTATEREQFKQDISKTQKELDNEKEFDPSTEAEGKKKTLRLIALRLGQPAFRQKLLTAYEQRCTVTGTSIESALEAAHIVAYNGESTNHISNGLLLRSDIHALFDWRLMSINPRTFRVYCSERIRKEKVYRALHGRKIRTPLNPGQCPSVDALRIHFEMREV